MGGDIFLYGLIVVMITYLIRRTQPSGSTIFGLVCGLAIVYMVRQSRVYQEDQQADKLQHIRDKPTIIKATALHSEEDILLFLHEYELYHTYNPYLYRELVDKLNAFVNIIKDIKESLPHAGRGHDNLLYENLLELRTEILNLYQSAIHSVPADDTFSNGAALLEKLLHYRLDSIGRVVIENNRHSGIHTLSRFPTKNTPRAIESTGAYVSRDRHMMY